MTSSEEDPLLSINAFSGTITVLRPMTDTERASAQVFTIKAYDSIYNDLYDLATLTIYAMDYGLTPYTPQT
ncbi:MAG: cadherin repeat domain-containing protein [Thermoguttaceae bacterium]|nr:cadherin repeat domain-containing protein [Thermoguttaceae bacterium]